MDPISRYCDEVDTTPAAFARLIRRSPQLLNDFKAGRCGLSDDTKLLVVGATGGKVTLEELTMWPTQARAVA